MTKLKKRIVAAAGAGAVAAGVAIGAPALADQSATAWNAEPVEPTVTEQTTQVAPSTPEITEAVPQITGPAPLPTEEQGVPG